jgi:outer membrane protein
MKQSMIGVAAALLLALVPTSVYAQGTDYKIGFVNTERLFREAAPAKRAQQKLEREFAGRDTDIQKLSKQVRDLQAQLEKDGVTMAEADRRNKERDLANMSRDLQRLQREFRERPQPAPQRELAAVQERANKVIQQIAEAEKFDLILRDPVVYASQRIDITDKVVKALADRGLASRRAHGSGLHRISCVTRGAPGAELAGDGES